MDQKFSVFPLESILGIRKLEINEAHPGLDILVYI